MSRCEKRGRRVNWSGQAPLAHAWRRFVVVTALLTDRFLSPFNLTNILVQSSIMAVIAIGMTFVIVGGGFDLSVGSTVALSGCIGRHGDVQVRHPRGRRRGHCSPARWSGSSTAWSLRCCGSIPFIATLGSMVLVRGVVYIITGGAPVSGEEGLPRAFIAFGMRGCLGIHYLVWVPALLLVRVVWRHRSDALWAARLRHRRQQEAAYLSGIAVQPRHRLDLRLVRRARRRRRR